MKNFFAFSLIFLICATLFRASVAVDNCALSQDELTARGDTCIKLALCNPGAICSFAYFPVCGAWFIVSESPLYCQNFFSYHVKIDFMYLGCDNETYFNSCNARGAGVSTYTVGECGAKKSLRERA